MKKPQTMKNRHQISQVNEDWADDLAGWATQSLGIGQNQFKNFLGKFTKEFTNNWKGWWKTRKNLQPAASSTTTPAAATAVPESKRFLDKSILSESEYNRLNNIFENIVHIEEASQDEIDRKKAEMDNFISHMYNKLWTMVSSGANAAQYEQVKDQWANSGIFGESGNLKNLIAFLAPLQLTADPPVLSKNSAGNTSAAGNTSSAPKSAFTSYDVKDAIQDLENQIRALNPADPKLPTLELYLEALKNYKI